MLEMLGVLIIDHVLKVVNYYYDETSANKMINVNTEGVKINSNFRDNLTDYKTNWHLNLIANIALKLNMFAFLYFL